jgi:hypothetical protein
VKQLTGCTTPPKIGCAGSIGSWLAAEEIRPNEFMQVLIPGITTNNFLEYDIDRQRTRPLEKGLSFPLCLYLGTSAF